MHQIGVIATIGKVMWSQASASVSGNLPRTRNSVHCEAQFLSIWVDWWSRLVLMTNSRDGHEESEAHGERGGDLGAWLTPNAGRLAVAVVVGSVSGVLFSRLGGWELGLVAGWGMFCLAYVTSVCVSVWRFDGQTTRRYALREDPARAVADIIIIIASIASISAVILLLVTSAAEPSYKALASVTALVSVILSWVMIHTLYTLRYAREYYRKPHGGIDFNGETTPRYSDFAYFAFNLGMTFQISDTSVTTNKLRRMVLWHSLLSYLFNTVIVATMVNLIIGFASGN